MANYLNYLDEQPNVPVISARYEQFALGLVRFRRISSQSNCQYDGGR